MFNNEIFNERLKGLRLELNLTQTQLAAPLGTTKGAIANYENGNRLPNFEMLIAIADYFNVSVDYLLGRSDVRSMQTTNQPNN